MEGFYWLLLQTLPLLTACAAVFFILGWRWRGQTPGLPTPAEPTEQIDTADMEAAAARKERDTARALEAEVRSALANTQTELQEALDRQTQLQKEVLRLSDEQKETQQRLQTTQSELEQARAHPPSEAATTSVPASEADKKTRSSRNPKGSASSKGKSTKPKAKKAAPRKK
ncbi:hypothetical protein SAMN02745166_04573 [Prosthecobacter debontii]|uniref:Uncharacterized protein n=1 Tax=Prosthecobacter debontii TaxID=48467 RepID=A0A1T4YZZ6_9BACT|nr:hypothetical protein [Prosthecobacter debontii]SKB06881.1 hypothetical protein SAMN02745166_04573 [Prosthecobacter debontii]